MGKRVRMTERGGDGMTDREKREGWREDGQGRGLT